MAAPMTPAEPLRSKEIKAREDAIKRKLADVNKTNKTAAEKRLKANKKPGATTKYNTQYIKGKEEGFSRSDYGAGAGAGIPYQIGNKSQLLSKPKPKPKPTKKPPLKVSREQLPNNRVIVKPPMIASRAELPNNRVGVNSGLQEFLERRKL